MNLAKIESELKQFQKQIVSILKLQQVQGGMLNHQRKLIKWIHDQTQIIKNHKDELKKGSTQGLIAGMMNKFMKSQSNSGFEKFEEDMLKLKAHIKNGIVPHSFSFQSNEVPKEIMSCLLEVKGKKWESFYGCVKGPLMEDMFLMRKQDFHKNIEKVIVKNIKFIMIEEKSAHMYQRNLVHEIFGRIFRESGSLSMVLRIDVFEDSLDHPYSIFCYVEDNRFKQCNQCVSWKSLNHLEQSGNNLLVEGEEKGKKIEVCEMNMLGIILSEIMVLPLQSLVSNFIILVKENGSVEITKCNEQSQSEIVEENSLKEHPSLRNPLFFFKKYLRSHQIQIEEAQKITKNKDLYSCFYKALEIVIELILNDFSTHTQSRTINSSICFNFNVFTALWTTFHKIILLSSWLKEMIEPLKDTITLSEIISHFCPIFNEININDSETFKQYKEFYLNVEIESYLATAIRKKTIQKYKDMFVNVDQASTGIKFKSSKEIYENIFKPVFEEINLLYINPVESIYILHFVSKFKFEYVPRFESLPQDWRNKKIWESCVQTMKEADLPFIDIGFDILAYCCDVDTFKLNKNTFEKIKQTPENQMSIQGILKFIDFLRANYEEERSKAILSNLLEKSFKHRKFQICKKLLDKKVRIRDFKEIIKIEELVDPLNEKLRSQILKTIQDESPQMHRLFSWEELMLVHLKKQGREVETFEFGKCLIPEAVFSRNMKDGRVINNISRKDYKFNVSRDIAVIETQGMPAFYIEECQYPLVQYFYKIFFKKFHIPEIMPYFTSFFHEGKLFHLIQHLPFAVNYQKGLMTFSENEFNMLTDDRMIAESIILSMVLIPGRVQFRDMVICEPNARSNRDLIFVVDWRDFYHKDFMNKAEKVNLNCKNSLFLLDFMNKNIHPEIIKKYADLDVLSLIEDVFMETRLFCDKVYGLQKKHCSKQNPKGQLLSMIFENGFGIQIIERLFQIKRAFKKKSGYEKNLSYNSLLQMLHRETSFYYNEIVSSSNSLLKREENLLDENWKRPFVNYMGMVDFFGSFAQLEEIEFSFPYHYFKFCFQGPTEVISSTVPHIKKFMAFTGELPLNLDEYNNDYFQYLMRNLDLADLDQSVRQKFFEAIRSKSLAHIENAEKKILPLSFIKFKNVEFMKEKKISSFSFERVESLVIQNCRLNEYELNNSPKSIENILYLNLSNITGLKYIGENTLFGKAIEIKHLRKLSINNCHELISIDIKCDILESLSLSFNESLENVYLYSMHLKNIYIYNTVNLSLENIGLYILKGINVILCKNSCHGDLMKLYSDSYDDYVAKILKYFLLRFFDPESRYIILLTMSKMKEVNDNLFTKVGIGSIKPISAVFNKFTEEAQNQLLAELFRIFFQNPYIQVIATGVISQSIEGTSSTLNINKIFRLMDEGISKAKKIKAKREFRFERASFKLEKDLIENLKGHLGGMRLDRNFTFVIDELILDPKEKALGKSNAESKNKDFKKRSSFSSKLFLAKREKLKKSEELQKDIMSKSSSSEPSKVNKSDNLEMQESNKSHKREEIQQIENDFIEIIKFLGISKEDIHKMTLQIKNSMFEIGFLIRMLQEDDDNEVVDVKLSLDERKSFKEVQSYSGEYNVEKEGKSAWKINRINIENSIIDESIAEKFNKDKLNSFQSIRSINLKKCVICSYEILSRIPLLREINLKDITISLNEDDNTNNGELFRILLASQDNLRALSLEKFFCENKKSQENLNQLWKILPEFKILNKLYLNDNTFNLTNLQHLNKFVEQSDVSEIQLLKFKIDKGSSEQKEEYEQTLGTLFMEAKNLKSLTIELNTQEELLLFMEAIALNSSLLNFRIQTSIQIPSKALAPLNKNSSIQSIASNAQLPIWLLNHVKSNSVRKSNIYMLDDDEIRPIQRKKSSENDVSSSGRLYNDYFRMGLSLDGGGTRGMILATEMHYIAKHVGYPIHKIFDCVGGTSIGGILALACTGTSDGITPVADTVEMMEIFSKYGTEIFKKSQIRQFRNLFDTKYAPESIQRVLKNYFKDCRLSNCLVDTNVVVTAVNRVDNKDYIFRSMESLLNRDKDFYMRDVARATSAAPTFFPSAEIKNIDATVKLSLVDGGIGMNNPSKLVIDEIKKIAANSGCDNNYFLLSLGTGKLPQENIPQFAGLKDLAPIIDSFTESATNFLERDLDTNYKGHFYRVSPLIEIESKKEAELDNTSEQIINTYRETGEEAARKYFQSTVIFGKYRNMNLIEWLKENTARKFDV